MIQLAVLYLLNTEGDQTANERSGAGKHLIFSVHGLAGEMMGLELDISILLQTRGWFAKGEEQRIWSILSSSISPYCSFQFR